MLQPCIKALGMSLKTQFRVNEMGVLSLQHMCKTDEGTRLGEKWHRTRSGIEQEVNSSNLILFACSCFVDFLIAPNDDELSDDE